METVQQNGRFTIFSNKFPSNIYSILFESCRNIEIQLYMLQYRNTDIMLKYRNTAIMLKYRNTAIMLKDRNTALMLK